MIGPTQKQIDAMRPRAAASWQADKHGRHLILSKRKEAGKRQRLTAVYLSRPGHPCTPEKLLWSSDNGHRFPTRVDWRTIQRIIKKEGEA